MDLTTLIGIGAGFACVLLSISLGGDISSFTDMKSVLIVLGGVVSATLASFPMKRIKNLLKAIKNVSQKNSRDIEEDVEILINMANTARKEGLLALEDLAEDIQDPFLKKGIMLIVDGSDPELIKGILETDLEFIKERHAENRGILDAAAAYSPAFGMIGTLIGLINMLQNLSDMSTLGPSMAVALVTTFYGTLLANLVFNPLSKKLKAVGNGEYLRKEMILEGLLSIQDGENPRIIREKLNAFTPRTQPKTVHADTGTEEQEAVADV